MSRILAGTIPYVSISYVGAGYAFEAAGHDQDTHFVAADTDADEDDGDQLHDVRTGTFFESPYSQTFTGISSGLLLENYAPLNPFQHGESCLKRALPLRI